MHPDQLLLQSVHTKPALVLTVVALLCAAFMAITFVQSAFNKIIDYSGNQSYFASQFEKSFLAKWSWLLLPVITIMELNSGLACAGGIVLFLITKGTLLLGFGLLSSAVTLLCLLFGQRVVKDYAGAFTLTGYFLVAIFGMAGYAFSI